MEEDKKPVVYKDEGSETFNKFYKWFVVAAGVFVALLMIGVIFTKTLEDYEVKPNFAPETAKEEVSPGELQRQSLDPRTHFPRKPEVIEKEQEERSWNDMTYWQRLKYYFFGIED